MRYSRQLGVAVPELDWVPSPSFVLRRAAILDCLKEYPPGRLLETGCGGGSLLYDLARLGFECTGVEVSPRARELADRILGAMDNASVLGELPAKGRGTYDYLLAFEVLEHIENDVEALCSWVDYLKPGGIVLLSVPAHRHRWNLTDLLAGHFRRYDRADAEAMVRKADLELIRVTTYGWPMSFIIERLRLLAKKRQAHELRIDLDSLTVGDRSLSLESGVDRRIESTLFPVYGSLPGRLLAGMAARFQRLFYRTDLGTSFLLLAKKP